MPGPVTQRWLVNAAVAMWLGWSAAVPAAGPAVSVSFNGPETRWEMLGAPQTARVISHDVVADGARRPDGAERIIVAAPIGQPTLFAVPTGRMPVVEVGEFQARLWVKASRPGVQLFARVVLPRSVDPQTGRAVSTLIRGPLYQQVGHWQQLTISNADKLLTNQLHVLRAADECD